jgi:4-amino-4-deoxy-L-arabinose transferase-like glycosyltransferase
MPEPLPEANPTTPASEPTVGPDRSPALRLADLIAPLFGLYVGEFLYRSAPVGGTPWALAILAGSLLLLGLRIHPLPWARAGDALQAVLALLIVISFGLDLGDWKHWVPAWQLLLFWAAACLMSALALARLKPWAIQLRLPSAPRLDRWDGLALGLLVGIAFLLRAWSIESIPRGVDSDEAMFGASAIETQTGAIYSPFQTGWLDQPTMEFYVTSIFTRTIGRSILAIRMPSAILGTLAVVALYLAARAIAGRRTALFAGTLAAASNVAIHFSRLGVNNIADGLFSAAVVGALWYAGSTGKARHYVVAGGLLGLAQYFYYGTRALPFIVAATLLIWPISDVRGTVRAWPLVLAFAVAAVTVSGPLLAYMVTHPAAITGHLYSTLPFSSFLSDQAAHQGVSVTSLWWNQVRQSLLFLVGGSGGGNWYNSGLPLVHPAQVPLFLIGVLGLLGGLRKPMTWGIAAWLLIILTLGSVLIVDGPTFHRLVGLVPAAILVVAMGADALVSAISRAARLRPKMTMAVAAVLVGLLAVSDAGYYFLYYSPKHSQVLPVDQAMTLATLDYEHQKGRGQYVWFGDATINPDTGRIANTLTRYVAGDDFRAGSTDSLEQLDASQPVRFYVRPERSDVLADLRKRFPGGTTQERYDPTSGSLLLTIYSTPAP